MTSNHNVFTCYLPLSLSLKMTPTKDRCLGVFSLKTASWIIAFLQLFYNVFQILADITLFNKMISLDDQSHPAILMTTSLLGSIVSDCAGIFAASLLSIGNCV